MSDLSQTAANVKAAASTVVTQRVTYGETITQGMPLYQSTDFKYYKADANDTAAKANARVIALTPGVADDSGEVALPATIADQSLVNLGATLTVGTVYAVSANAGAICPVSEITSGQYVCVLGIAKTSALLDFQIAYCSVVKA